MMVATEIVMAWVAMIVARAGIGHDDFLLPTFMGPVGIQTQFLQDVSAAVDARQNQLH